MDWEMWRCTGERCYWDLYHEENVSTQFDIEPGKH